MEKSFLFPNYLKKIGWAIFIPSFIYFILCFFINSINFRFQMFSLFPHIKKVYTDMFWTILPACITVGFIFIAFSKNKNKNNIIKKTRKTAWIWSLNLFNYLLIFLYTISFATDFLIDDNSIIMTISLFCNIYILLIIYLCKYYLIKKKQTNKIYYLFPKYFRIIGWFLFIISITCFIIIEEIKYNPYNIQDLGFLFFILIFIGLLLICFSKEKIENEFVNNLRKESAFFSAYIFLVCFLFLVLTVYGLSYIPLLIHIPALLFIIYIILFKIKLYKYKKELRYEE